MTWFGNDGSCFISWYGLFYEGDCRVATFDISPDIVEVDIRAHSDEM